MKIASVTIDCAIKVRTIALIVCPEMEDHRGLVTVRALRIAMSANGVLSRRFSVDLDIVFKVFICADSFNDSLRIISQISI